jgi:hypothetical protein
VILDEELGKAAVVERRCRNGKFQIERLNVEGDRAGDFLGGCVQTWRGLKTLFRR